MKTVVRRLKFESELDLSFGEHVASGRTDRSFSVASSAGPAVQHVPQHYMDYTPRKIIAMTREGFKDEVLKA